VFHEQNYVKVKDKQIPKKHEIFLSSFNKLYSVFQVFRQAKSANGGSILSSSQFLLLPQLPQKIKLALKVVKVDSKIIISLPKI
jgi:hypothetical protein